MTDGRKAEACASALVELERAEGELRRLIAEQGGDRRKQWVLTGPLPFEGVDFQVRLSLSQVLDLLVSNRAWVRAKLVELAGGVLEKPEPAKPDPQRWVRTERVLPWWRRIFG